MAYGCGTGLDRDAPAFTKRHLDRAALPTMGQMLDDQIGSDAPMETQDEMRRHALDL